MCGRYALIGIDELKDEYGWPADFEFMPNYNIAPTQNMPVVTDKGLEIMRWGIIPAWAKDEKIGYRLINTRSETVFDKPMWKGIVTKKRCLIPANGFYEWQKQGDSKQPFYIRTKDQKLFMFAGIWETWKHEGIEINTYSILTTEPNREMVSIHDRMPVILSKQDHVKWLAADGREQIESLLLPYQDNGLEMYPVGKDVNSVKVNEAKLILPVGR